MDLSSRLTGQMTGQFVTTHMCYQQSCFQPGSRQGWTPVMHPLPLGAQGIKSTSVHGLSCQGFCFLFMFCGCSPRPQPTDSAPCSTFASLSRLLKSSAMSPSWRFNLHGKNSNLTKLLNMLFLKLQLFFFFLFVISLHLQFFFLPQYRNSWGCSTCRGASLWHSGPLNLYL